MNTPASISARLAHPVDLVTALPYLLGFHPRDSLVVVTIQPGSPPTVGLMLRADLPPPGAEHELAEQLCAPLRARGTGAVMIVVVGGPECVPAAVAVLRTALDDLGVVVVNVLWAEATTHGARWSCLDEPATSGVLPDPSDNGVAAASALAGVVTFATRDELARLVEPDDEETLGHRGALLDAAVRDLGTDDPAPSASDRGLDLVRAAVDAAAVGRLPTTDDEIVRLAVALSDPLIRDSCLGWCLGGTAAAAERLWQALTRATPAPEVAEPASLAALSAYLRGDGALAGIALDRAEAAWPGHTLSTLLHYVVANAIPPRRLDRFVRDATAHAALAMADAR